MPRLVLELLTFLVTAGALIVVPARSGDWPQFRGPGNSASSDADVPLTWSETENVAWKTPLPGGGSSSPLLVGDRIYLTAFSGYGFSLEEPGNRDDLRLHVLSFDRATGKPLWDVKFPASPREQNASKRTVDHGYASPTAVADDEAVYAYFGVSGVYAVAREGNSLWHADVGEKTAGFGTAASPILHQDLVIVNASIEAPGVVYAFDKRTGAERWRIEGVERSWSTPTIVDVPGGGSELIVSFKEHLCGYDPRTGEQLWTCEGIQDYVVPCVIVHDGILYCFGGRTNQSMAVRPGGRGDVTQTHRIWESRYAANVTSPIYHDGYLYWAHDKSQFLCMDASDGSLAWRARLPSGSRVYASVVRAGDRLYAATRDNGVVVIAADPTEYRQLAQNKIEGDAGPMNATPAIGDGRLYLRTNEYLYCIADE